jgi:acetyltransferase
MSLLSPSSIAIIGASAEEKKVGHIVLKNLISQGYKGAIYPVNPKGGEILGKTAYASVAAIPGEVDLAVVVTPAKTVASLAEECGKKGVKTLVVISAGFGEIGTNEGHAMEKSLVETAKKYKMKLIGPNCLGVMRPSAGINVSFAENLEKSGSIALLSQSGALAVALLDAAQQTGLAFSLMVSMGNKAAMDECDFLEVCAEDPETKVIGMYVESINNGKRFLEVAKRVAQKKPIVLIKSGVSEHGRKAVSSHTGALAGSDSAIDAACMQTGIHRARSAEEFTDLLQVFSMQPSLLSPHIAVITNAGGPGILATDSAEKEGLMLVALEEKSEDRLRPSLPPAASTGNPIDVLGDADEVRYAAALDTCADDPNIDGIVVLLTPQVMTPAEKVADAVINMHRDHPLIPVTASFMGNTHVTKAIEKLQKAGIPNYPTPERAMRAMGALKHGPHLRQGYGGQVGLGKKECHVSHLADSLLKDKKGLLSEETVQELFALYNLPLIRGRVAKSAEEAVRIAEDIGYPVVAKVSSPQILHKTDIGAVRVNLKTADEVAGAYKEIVKNSTGHFPGAVIDGVLLQQFLPAGSEFIVGALRDPSFGHLVMAGLGGIYTELFRDTAFRIAPIGEQEGYEMLQQLRSWKLLLGLRGQKQSDIEALAKLIANVSHLVHDCPQISELDLNPVLVWNDKVVIADAKVVID